MMQKKVFAEKKKMKIYRTNIHHHHLLAQYAEVNIKICNVSDKKANSFSSNNCQ